MSESSYRQDLPPAMPARMRRLPVHRGYPVPWFVAWLDGDQQPVAVGEGEPDFRVLKPGAIEHAWNRQRCWICGGPLGVYKAFVVGPMCAINRTSAEPPGHLDCADWSARACPFLARPHARRRDAGKPEGTIVPAGIGLMRNPGVALVWVTDRPRVRRTPTGDLFNIGQPTQLHWYAEGREATREEVAASIDSGYPELYKLAEAEGAEAIAELESLLWRARQLLPAA